MDFILERARIRFADKFDTFVQPFNHTYDKTNAIKVTGPDGEDVYVVSPQYNPATPLPGGITAGLVDTPVDDARGSMCLEDHWAGVEVKGKLALVKRGVCAVADKLRWAKKKGALGKFRRREGGEVEADESRCYSVQPGPRHWLLCPDFER